MKSTTLESHELMRSVIETLIQGEALLSQITDAQYTRKEPMAFNASIGGHYRHCLDHFRTVLQCAAGGDLNYDDRERGTLIEVDRFAALNATRELRDAYEQLGSTSLTRPLNVTSKTSYRSATSQSARSTFAREMMYAVAHAVHHYALIGVMCKITGLETTPGFGVAPSTLKHRCDSAKALA